MRGLGLALLALCACVRGTFHCERDEQCERTGARCEPTGFCSFEDATCPGGRRYDEYAGAGLERVCLGCFDDVVGGEAHLCARRGDGTVWCWGRNADSQLTTGLAALQAPPAMVPALSSVAQLRAGERHTCSRLADDTLRCFGENVLGQVGVPLGAPVGTPTAPAGLGPVTDFDAGAEHTCAIGRDQRVSCWGNGSEGQLGDGTSTSSSMPRTVEVSPGMPLTGAIAVATGDDHACAIAGTELYCWGDNGNGQLGNGSTTPSPRAIPVLGNVAEVACGNDFTCARRTDGSVWCWGQNDVGQLGNGGTGDEPAPIQVTAIAPSPTGALALGDVHACALVGLRVWCWGENRYGRFTAPESGVLPATEIADLAGARAIAVTSNNTCALLGETIACRGTNDQFQLATSPLDTAGPAFHPLTVVPLACE